MLIRDKQLAKAAHFTRSSLTPAKLSLVSSISQSANNGECCVEGRAEAYEKHNQANSRCYSQERWLICPFVLHPRPPCRAASMAVIPTSSRRSVGYTQVKNLRTAGTGSFRAPPCRAGAADRRRAARCDAKIDSAVFSRGANREGLPCAWSSGAPEGPLVGDEADEISKNGANE